MPKAKTPRLIPAVATPLIDTSDEGRTTVIMFVDIVGASEVSNHKALKDYFNFVNRFQAMFKEVCEKSVKNWYDKDDEEFINWHPRGDEGVLMIFRETNAVGVSADVDTAINIAFELKRKWIGEEENSKRIQGSGLLPIDLAIGIHVGKTWLEKNESDGRWNPEGYAINLAKRVESYSRLGKFTHIFLSEAAHGYLNVLPDERTYLFDNAQTFSPKGISRDITVYEVKHHYLPTDWKEPLESGNASNRSKAFLDPESVDLTVLETALSINPTNLWLVEEYIRSSMLMELQEWVSKGKKGADPRYQNAWTEATRLTQSDQRDAGGLFIQGLIEGERGEAVAEQEHYQDAIDYTDQLAEAYWYQALSYSYQVYDSLNGNLETPFDDLNEEQQGWVMKAKDCFEKAKLRRANSAWIPFDYGCEIIRWAKNDDELGRGLELIEIAVSRLPDVRDEIGKQPYLTKVEKNEKIRALLAQS